MEHAFFVDEATMLAPSSASVAEVHQRDQMLRYMPRPPPAALPGDSFQSNHPKCRFCGGAARPAVALSLIHISEPTRPRLI
eukprot:4555127-Amphidinium_carterae.1